MSRSYDHSPPIIERLSWRVLVSEWRSVFLGPEWKESHVHIMIHASIYVFMVTRPLSGYGGPILSIHHTQGKSYFLLNMSSLIRYLFHCQTYCRHYYESFYQIRYEAAGLGGGSSRQNNACSVCAGTVTWKLYEEKDMKTNVTQTSVTSLHII